MPIIYFTSLLLSFFAVLPITANAEQSHIVEHIDIINIDPQLSLADLVNQTLKIMETKLSEVVIFSP